MKRRGVALTLAACILYLLGDFTGIGWIRIADALLWAMVLLSLAIPRLSVSRLQVAYRLESRRRDQGPGPMEGEEVTLITTLGNRRMWPGIGVVLRLDLLVNQVPQRRLKLFVPYVGPKRRLIVEGTMTAARRGLYTVRGLAVESDAPFGLFRSRRRVDGEESLLVYPAPHTMKMQVEERSPTGPVAHALPVRRGDDPSGSRPYVSGDTAREVHWRNSARTGRLMTRSFTAAANETSVLLFGAPPDDDGLLDVIARVVAGVGQACTRGGSRVRLQTGSRLHELEWKELLRMLALASADSLPTLAESLRAVPPGSSVVAVLPASDSAGLDDLVRSAPGCTDLQVLLVEPGYEEADRHSDAVLALERAGAAVSHYSRDLSDDPDTSKPLR